MLLDLSLGRAALASEEPIQFSGTVLRPNERAVAAAATRKAQGDKGAPGSLVGAYDDAAPSAPRDRQDRGRQSCFSSAACLRRTHSVTSTPSWISTQIPKTNLKKCSGGNDSPIFTIVSLAVALAPRWGKASGQPRPSDQVITHPAEASP